VTKSENGARTDTIEASVVEHWLSIHDELLRGIMHSMSNRIATISAGVWVIGEAGVAAHADSVRSLQGEVDQMEQLLIQLRMLPRQSEPVLEPLLPHESVKTAIALHEHHSDFRNIERWIVDAESVKPARADPHALLHALLVAINVACEAAQDSRIAVTIRSDDEYVTFTATGDVVDNAIIADDRFDISARSAEWLLRGSRGRASSHRFGCTVAVPTLAFSRQMGF
jgi:hypothetical protein